MSAATRFQRITTAVQSSFAEFVQRSTSTGITILVITAIALVWTNSPWHASYEAFLHQPVKFVLGPLDLSFSLEHFVNDGLMVLFFLVVGLEIKRELIVGELSSRQKALLPMIAAIFGMVGPAVTYLLFNGGTDAARGWGVPVATDIAFALGVLALLGDRVPNGLRVFLAALAIVDDLLAVVVIAVFYTAALNVPMLLLALAIVIVLYGGNRLGVHSLWFYGVLGFLLWLVVLASGVHATIAGVALAMCIPAHSRIDRISFFTRSRDLIDQISKRTETDEDEGKQLDAVHALEEMCEHVQTPLHRIEHGLSTVVSFGIMPLFALVNAGVVITPAMIDGLASPVALGIALGLFLGKQIGISGSVWLSVRLGLTRLPSGVSMAQMYGVSLLCGIGFTMALFVAHLAFISPEHLEMAKLSILIGSTLSAVIGAVVLRRLLPPAPLPS
ncbi:MAG: Na+/H+ antiporter NhaA [Candidatus Kapabacteria bacterium]|nr:Na+/H+ antiporter NhaA [Candidatus Kapabacteria bacterium]